MKTWLRFNAVGMSGAAVQLAVLALLTRGLGMHYLVATLLAVEAALLNNFFWHVRWTWRDRHPSLWRFHVANGFVSMLANLLLMRLFTGWLGVAAEPANLLAIVLTGLVNFFLGDRWAFAERRDSARSAR